MSERPMIEYYEDGSIRSERWFRGRTLHREDGPALIDYHKHGSVAVEEWWQNGSQHRSDGPAWIEYYEDGSVRSEGWFLNGSQHREDGPSWTTYIADGSVEREEWCEEGVRLGPPSGAVALTVMRSGTGEDSIYLCGSLIAGTGEGNRLIGEWAVLPSSVLAAIPDEAERYHKREQARDRTRMMPQWR